jgi:hypothetical protein
MALPASRNWQHAAIWWNQFGKWAMEIHGRHIDGDEELLRYIEELSNAD